MSKIVNNVRARLHKDGISGVSKTEIESIAVEVGCKDLENPTTNEINITTTRLKEKYSSQLAVEKEFMTEENQQAITLPTPQPSESGGELMTRQEIENQIQLKSTDLGVVLTAEQAEKLADEIDLTNVSLVDMLNQIETALMNYARYSTQQKSQAIASTFARVTDEVIYGNQKNQQEIEEGFDALSQSIRKSEEQAKQQLGRLLQRLSLPA